MNNRRRRNFSDANALVKKDCLQSFSALRTIDDESDKRRSQALEELNTYLAENAKSIKSESDIFGRITIEITAKNMPEIVRFLNERGFIVDENSIPLSKPKRRNQKVSIRYYSKNIGIINTPI